METPKAPKRWLINLDGGVLGPVALTDLKRLASSGQILPADQVQIAGSGNWIAASQVAGLFPQAVQSAVENPFSELDGSEPIPSMASYEAGLTLHPGMTIQDMKARRAPRIRLWVAAAAFLVVVGGGIGLQVARPWGNAPSAKAPEPATVTPAKASAGLGTAKEPFKLEATRVPVKTFDGIFGDKRVVMQSTWTPTIKLVRQDSGALPGCADDLWIWYVYISGTPSAKEITSFMETITVDGMPKGSVFHQTSDMPQVNNTVFRFAEKVFDLQAVEKNAYSEKYDRLAFSMLLAPDKVGERWKGTSTSELQFPINYHLDSDRLTNVILNKVKPFEECGVVAICLCGFDATTGERARLMILSQPLVLTLVPEKNKDQTEK